MREADAPGGDTLGGLALPSRAEVRDFSSDQAARGMGFLTTERGAFLGSVLAVTDADSLHLRTSFIRAYLQRDVAMFRPRIPAETLERLRIMPAHNQGALLYVWHQTGGDHRCGAGKVMARMGPVIWVMAFLAGLSYGRRGRLSRMIPEESSRSAAERARAVISLRRFSSSSGMSVLTVPRS